MSSGLLFLCHLNRNMAKNYLYLQMKFKNFLQGTTIYMSIHIFDFAINTMSKAELAATMASGREIGCHKLVVNVFSGH